jgi:hypothetical protein
MVFFLFWDIAKQVFETQHHIGRRHELAVSRWIFSASRVMLRGRKIDVLVIIGINKDLFLELLDQKFPNDTESAAFLLVLVIKKFREDFG